MAESIGDVLQTVYESDDPLLSRNDAEGNWYCGVL